MRNSIGSNWGRGALAVTFALAAVSACGGDDGPGGAATGDSFQSQDVNLKGETLAHFVQMRGQINEHGMRVILKSGQNLCVQAKEVEEGKIIENPKFPSATALVARVDQDVYYTQYATITYTKNYTASVNEETCDVLVAQNPTREEIRVSDGRGACTFNVNARGVKFCSLSRGGYRASLKDSASGMGGVVRTSMKGDNGCMEVDYKLPQTSDTQRVCVLLRNDGWQSYTFFGTDLAGPFIEDTSAKGGRFDDPESITWHFEASTWETDIMVPNDVIYPHLSGKYSNIDFSFVEDERLSGGSDDDDDAAF